MRHYIIFLGLSDRKNRIKYYIFIYLLYIFAWEPQLKIEEKNTKYIQYLFSWLNLAS